MRFAYLVLAALVLTTVTAKRSLLSVSVDPYGIVPVAAAGNEAAAVVGFVKAGSAVDTTPIVAALVQIFNTVVGPAGQKELYLTAEALSKAALQAPAIWNSLSSAYVQAVLGQFTINTPTSIQVATAALAAMRSAQQSQIVQLVFQEAFTVGLYSQAALAVGTMERMGPCTNSTFFAAQYALALGHTITVNQTAAGLALAAALNADLAGCAVAAATGIPLLEAGCSTATLKVLATAQSAMIAATGDNTALATSIATYAPSNKTLTCLATSIIQYSGQDAVAQSAATESYQTVVDQAAIGAGASSSTKVAGAGESLFEATEGGVNTASGMSSLAGLAALAQTTSCNYIYPVLIQSQNYMTPQRFQQSVGQSAALSSCLALGMQAANNTAASG